MARLLKPNIMTTKEKINFIDDFLARCEDWMHGNDGIDVTQARKHLIDIEKHLKPSESPECAMPVVGQSFYCLNAGVFGLARKCKEQCLSCAKNIPKQ